LRAEGEEGLRAGRLQPRDRSGQGTRVTDGVQRAQIVLQRREGGGLRFVLVHAGSVEVAHLLRERVGWVRLAAGVLLQDGPEQRLVALEDLRESAAPSGAILAVGRLLPPAAAGVLL